MFQEVEINDDGTAVWKVDKVAKTEEEDYIRNRDARWHRVKKEKLNEDLALDMSIIKKAFPNINEQDLNVYVESESLRATKLRKAYQVLFPQPSSNTLTVPSLGQAQIHSQPVAQISA